MTASLNGRVLLLNFSYEPLGTVGVARAMCLVIRGVVFVEEFDGQRVLRSPREEFRVPSVVRLRRYVNVRRRRQASGMKRLRIFVRDRFRCQYCGQKRGASELTLDHITPRSRGGPQRARQPRDGLRRVQHAQGQPHARGGAHASAHAAEASRHRPGAPASVPLR